MVPTGDTTSNLDKLEMDATTDQNHVDQMMKKICQLTKTNKILGDRIKKTGKKNAILSRQGQKDKKPTNKNESYLTKLDPTGCHQGSQHQILLKKDGIGMEPQEKTLLEGWRTIRIGGMCDGQGSLGIRLTTKKKY